MKAYIEGFGCSLNQADTQAIKGFLQENGFQLAESRQAGQADLIIINTCAVKKPTEFRMLKRIRQLLGLKKKKTQLIVFGCLPEINPAKVKEISRDLVLLGPRLKDLASFLGLKEKSFNPSIKELRKNQWQAIIPIARGCLGECAYCAVKNARGKLHSYAIEELNCKFKKLIEEAKEVWLTAQDLGAYGWDKKKSLPELLEKLLANEGAYRIRLGMMNLQHLKKFYPKLLALMKRDERLYRFLHVPLQSGSNKILRKMRRQYSCQEFLKTIARIRQQIPKITIATDVIVGFPGETDADFKQTVKAIKKLRPDIVNISRYGDRPNTEAEKMKDKVYGWIKKQRSRKLSALMSELDWKKNKRWEGKKVKALFTEKGEKGNFLGRTNYYKPVIAEKDLRGKFAAVKIVKAFPTYLKAKA